VTRVGSLGIRTGLIHFQNDVDLVLHGPVQEKRIRFIPKAAIFSDIAQCSPQINCVAFSPQANYTDRSTVTGRGSSMPSSADRRVLCGQPGGSPRPLISVYKTGGVTCLFK
jgi:hypothetical protein